jgi:hypothetical protein
VVTSGQVGSGHLSDTDGNGLSLGGHEDDLLVELDVGFCQRHKSDVSVSFHEDTNTATPRLTESEQTGKHELGSVTDGVDGRVLDDESLVAGQQGLEGSDDSSKVRL